MTGELNIQEKFIMLAVMHTDFFFFFFYEETLLFYCQTQLKEHF